MYLPPSTLPAAGPPRFFEDEISATSRKHDEAGLLSMANMGVPNSNGSQFFFSMRGDDMQHLDGKHTVFAKVGWVGVAGAGVGVLRWRFGVSGWRWVVVC